MSKQLLWCIWGAKLGNLCCFALRGSIDRWAGLGISCYPVCSNGIDVPTLSMGSIATTVLVTGALSRTFLCKSI